MIFAHRGLVTKNSPQNSIQSLQAAFDAGFRGIEFDLWFVDGEILIKHDQPKKDEKLPRLAEYFCFKNELTYWLDFKNLNQKNAREVFEFVALEIKKAEIDYDKIFLIPFETNYEIAAFFYEEAKKVFGDYINFGAVCEADVVGLEKFCAEKNVKFLSVFHELIDESFIKKFSTEKIFAWTIKDKKTFEKLQKLGVENFASDLALNQLI